MMVTFVPNALNTSANSMPIAPAPMMPRLAGAALANTAWSEFQTRSPSILRMGSDFAREPVARMMCFAEIVRSPSLPLTTTLPPPASRPQP